MANSNASLALLSCVIHGVNCELFTAIACAAMTFLAIVVRNLLINYK